MLWIEEVLDVSIGNTVCVGGGVPQGVANLFSWFSNNRKDWKENFLTTEKIVHSTVIITLI